MLSRFRRRLWQPPRAHGEIIEDRTISFLELFYDLVYVVVISRASHTLAGDVTWQGVGHFAVVFGLIWIAWLNGTIYYDLHGREDVRTRFFVFVQMLVLALLGVFTADATGADGPRFALTYAAFLGVLTWLWRSVRRQDAPEFMTITKRYLIGMVMSIAAMIASAFMPGTARLILWALLVVGWESGFALLGRGIDPGAATSGLAATDSLVERFDLFTIIVLGEVVVGVVTGLSEADVDVTTAVTGMVGLMIGFGIWWTYFDFVGRRRPRADRIIAWQAGHLPVALSVAASGAAMVSLIEHAGDGRAPAETAWLLSGAVAVALGGLVATMTTLADFDRHSTIYRPLSRAMSVAAVAAVLIGWWRPAPWLLVLTLVGSLSLVWAVAVDRWLRLDQPERALPGA